jgi:hypothetical protein
MPLRLTGVLFEFIVTDCIGIGLYTLPHLLAVRASLSWAAWALPRGLAVRASLHRSGYLAGYS